MSLNQRGTTQNSSSRELCIVLHSCLHFKATVLTTLWFNSSTSTAGLLFHNQTPASALKYYGAFAVSFGACLYPPTPPQKAATCSYSAHTISHQLHTCQTVINESSSNVVQPRSPSCLSPERRNRSQTTASTACSSNPQSGGKDTFTSGTAENMLLHYTVARWLQCINTLPHAYLQEKSLREETTLLNEDSSILGGDLMKSRKGNNTIIATNQSRTL